MPVVRVDGGTCRRSTGSAGSPCWRCCSTTRASRWLPGGLLGVDAFFVLSGFLDHRAAAERVAVDRADRPAGFWARRARRLLPALVLLLVLVSIDVAVTGSGRPKAQLPLGRPLGARLRRQLALRVQPPGLLRRLVTVIRCCTCGRSASRSSSTCCGRSSRSACCGRLDASRRRERGALPSVSVLLALVSAAWMAFLAVHLHASTDRLYYGTDTRAALCSPEPRSPP